MMKRILFLFPIILLLDCKSLTDSSSSAVKLPTKSGDLKEVSIEVDCRTDNDIKAEISKNTSIHVQPTLCDIFGDYLNDQKTVLLKIEGNLENESFNRNAGYYCYIENLDGKEKTSKINYLEFSNFGFIENESKLKNSIPFKVFATRFDVRHNAVDNKNVSNGKYELTFIFRPPQSDSGEKQQ